MRKFLALVLALVMTMSLVTVSAGAATAFTDDAAITNEEAVEVLNAIGILGGYADGSFRPQGNLTRGAGAKMIAFLMLGEEAAKELKATYTVFEDVTDTVGNAAYIEWAEANGIVGGYGNGKFGPYDTLTQYAFGKMLLTAIGFESAEEGYTGAGWQKNVFGDAYAKGIFDGSETYGACLREDAARMVMAALETTFVVYGSASINNGDFLINGHIASIGDNRITVDGAWDTDLYVWETYEDLYFNGKAFDDWGNPGDYWEYDGEEIGFYEDEALKTYTTKVDNCDLLVDLGVAASSSKTVNLKFIYNGNFEVDGEDYVKNDKNDADRYYITTVGATVADLGHAAEHVKCDDNFIGGQGVLTKVFATETKGEYLVTEVATYLAKVEKVTKDHSGNVAELKIGYRNLENYGLADNDVGDWYKHDLHSDAKIYDALDTYKLATSDYAKNDYVLVTVNVWNNLADGKTKTANLVIVDHELATPTLGVLTGWEFDKDEAPEASKTKIDYVAEADAFGFSKGYGYDLTKKNANTSYNFYFDAYGNVIGAVKPEATFSYVVVDYIWTDHKTGDGKLSASANVVGLDATVTNGVDIAKFNGTKAAELNEEDRGSVALGTKFVMPNGKDNDAHYYYLYSFSVKDGKYTLQNLHTDKSADADKNYFYNTAITYENGDDDLFYYDNTSGKYYAIQLTEETEILVRDYNGNYTAAVGYKDKALKSLTAKSAEVIFDKYGFAAVVFLNEVTFLDAYVTGYIVDTDALNVEMIGEDLYYKYNFYVDGVAMPIFVDVEHDDILTYYGLYEAQFDAIGGNLVVDKLKTDLQLDGKDYYAYGAANGAAEGWYDRTTIKVLAGDQIVLDTNDGDDEAETLNDVAVYGVDMTSGGTDVFVASVDDLAEKQLVDTVRDEDGKLVAIYILIAE